VRLLWRGHLHEAVPPRAAVELVGHQRGGDDCAGVEKHRLEVVALDAVRQIANVQKGFIHGGKLGEAAIGCQGARGWHRRCAGVNSRLAKLGVNWPISRNSGAGHARRAWPSDSFSMIWIKGQVA